MTFNKGDIVRVDYASPRAIEQWMAAGVREGPGPGDVGTVKYDIHSEAPGYHGNVSVEFPMLGTFGVHSSNLKLVQKFSETAK